jgi:peptidoglycan/LPS O-acetylase OafA/YrhL
MWFLYMFFGLCYLSGFTCVNGLRREPSQRTYYLWSLMLTFLIMGVFAGLAMLALIFSAHARKSTELGYTLSILGITAFYCGWVVYTLRKYEPRLRRR